MPFSFYHISLLFAHFFQCPMTPLFLHPCFPPSSRLLPPSSAVRQQDVSPPPPPWSACSSTSCLIGIFSLFFQRGILHNNGNKIIRLISLKADFTSGGTAGIFGEWREGELTSFREGVGGEETSDAFILTLNKGSCRQECWHVSKVPVNKSKWMFAPLQLVCWLNTFWRWWLFSAGQTQIVELN